MATTAKPKRGEKRCEVCGYHKRGRNHEEGKHHKNPNANLISKKEK